MIPSSPPLKLAALAIALAVNGAGFGLVFRSEPVEIEGGADATVARLGASFVDLASGSPLAPDAPRPLAPDAAETPVLPDGETKPAPITADSARSDTTHEPVRPTPPRPANAAPAILQATPPDAAKSMVVPKAPPVEVVATSEAATSPSLSRSVSQMRDAPGATAVAPSPPETITAEPTEPGVVRRSPRPGSRSDAFERAHRRVQADPPARQAARGNSEMSARAGTADGDRAERAARSGAGSARSTQAGNAAASNYPGEVMRRLSRIRRPAVRATGTATIAFRVAASGGLASASIARSSGSADLDRQALRMVHRAAPFPPPPAGAQSSFSINIAGR